MKSKRFCNACGFQHLTRDMYRVRINRHYHYFCGMPCLLRFVLTKPVLTKLIILKKPQCTQELTCGNANSEFMGAGLIKIKFGIQK